MDKNVTARFVEPMLPLCTEKLPDGPAWVHELKFDRYRALAIKTGGKIHLRSRNDNDFNARYTGIVKALASPPDDTIIDGEVVALDPIPSGMDRLFREVRNALGAGRS